MPIPMVASPLFSYLASKTYNAAWYSGLTNNDKINAAIAAATADGALYVAIPASLLPHTVTPAQFGTILPITEGYITDNRIVGNRSFSGRITSEFIGFDGTFPFTGNQQSNYLETTGDATATSTIIGLSVKAITANAAFTVGSMSGLRVFEPIRGAASTIVFYSGLMIDTINIVTTSSFGIFISQVSGGTVNNYGIKIEDVTGTGAFAIKTGLGIVNLGDELFLPATTTSRASLNVPHGTAPSSPANGDIWTTSAGLFVRINGVTVGPLT